jgi:hypothetical protein
MPEGIVRRIIRPDGGLPIILHAQAKPREIIITSARQSLVDMHRHYDPNLSTLVNCVCDPPCSSHRVETFAAGLALVERTLEHEVWEEVLLQLTEVALISINRALLTKHEREEIRGAWFIWQRQSESRNASVIVKWQGITSKPPDPFDIGWCLIKRRSISIDFFKRVVVPEKPRMPLGTPQKKG